MLVKLRMKGMVEGEFNVIKKKVSKIGGSYFICLPLEWVKWHNLKPGDEVAVIYDKEMVRIIAVRQ